MKFFDSFRIAVHNLWQNKSRTLLTIIIVLVVSALIMAMCLLGTNFISNNDRMLTDMLNEQGTTYVVSGSYDPDSSMREYRYPEYRQIKELMDIARKYPDAVDYSGVKMWSVSYSDESYSLSMRSESLEQAVMGLSDTVVFTDFSFPMPATMCAAVKEGRTWNADDNGSYRIWLSQDAMMGLAKLGYNLKLGDPLPISFELRRGEDKNGSDTVSVTNSYTLTGIFEKAQSNNSWQRLPDVYISADFLKEFIGDRKLYVGSVDMGFYRAEGTYNYRTTVNAFKKFVDEVNAQLGPAYNDEGEETVYFSNEFLKESRMMRIIGLVILGIMVILAFLILLLSIGSVANTIIISVDKNRKFIGLMKAMGLKNKGVNSIVYKEALITILIGVVLATCLVLCLGGPMTSLLDMILGGMYYSSEFTVRFTVSPYVPICTVLAFLGMAILFSRGSLNKMGKADVITIISEVA